MQTTISLVLFDIYTRATEAGQFDVVKRILGHERGRNTISRTRKSDKRTALMIACVEGYHDIAKYIMETCVVRLKDLDSMKRNVFHHAAKHTEVLEALIDVCCSKVSLIKPNLVLFEGHSSIKLAVTVPVFSSFSISVPLPCFLFLWCRCSCSSSCSDRGASRLRGSSLPIISRR